jgi:hypothetical protein
MESSRSFRIKCKFLKQESPLDVEKFTDPLIWSGLLYLKGPVTWRLEKFTGPVTWVERLTVP